MTYIRLSYISNPCNFHYLKSFTPTMSGDVGVYRDWMCFAQKVSIPLLCATSVSSVSLWLMNSE